MKPSRNKDIGAHTQKGKKVREFLGKKEIREGVYISSSFHSPARWGVSGSENSESQLWVGVFYSPRVCLIYPVSLKI